ncbi:MAG: DNA polymerase [Chitinophagaceae bacterium]|jgi:hypothetical protein
MKFGTFDIESTNWIHFEVLGFFDGQEYFTFWDIKKFLFHLNRKAYNGFRIYAHNGGKFDFLFIFQELLDRGWIERIIERQGRMIAIRCNTGKMSFTLCDSYAILPARLSKLSAAFNPRHKKLEMDYKAISAHDARTLKYLENDVLCLWEVLYDFFSYDFIVQPQLTIASQAMNTFRSKFFSGEITEMRIAHEEFIRKHYYSGGRVEMYKGYGRNIHVYDVNSLYPFVMLQPMPCGRMKVTDRYRKNKIGFYYIDIKKTPEWYISPLLHRGDKLTFLKGAGKYYVGSPTIDILHEQGVQFKVINGYYFESQETLFTDYVNSFFALKNKSKGTALYLIAKLFLNSLYGKFGAHRHREAIVQGTGYEEDTLLPSLGSNLASYGMVLIQEESRSKFIAPYLAAYITELARVHHFRLMNQHPEEMFYCDTDSLFTTAKYKTGTKIGELSLQGTYKEGVFLGNKTYALQNGKESKVAFRGFSSDDISFQQVKDALIHKVPIIQEREVLLSMRQCSTAVNVSREEGEFLKMRIQKKQTKTLDYDKRVTYPSKKFILDSTPHTQQTLKGI